MAEERKKKKILLLSDDLRMSSGIATVSKDLVFGTFEHYDWVQLGAAVDHPEKGKEIDLGEDAKRISGIEDASLKIIPWSGYGDANILRELIMRHQPDAILHFTDPRYWRWLYEMEAELRQNLPILFYHIWDDLPDPKYNRDYYESCDWLGCISRQTYGIVNRVGKIDSETIKPLEDWQVSYVPHGINPDLYKPVEVPQDFRKQLLGDKDYKFVLFWMNRNIKRKQPSDVIWAFSKFVDGLPEEDKDKVCLVMHTAPIDQNGTDLIKVAETLAPTCDIKFSDSRVTQEQLNYLYNLSDVTINIAGNEGFGLVTAESVMAGTPSIVNVTGGLQDQCGFKWNVAPKGMNEQWEYLTAEDYIEIGSLHDWRKWEDKVTHGSWVKPVWSRVQTMVGSVPTPYIIDDKVDIYEVADAIRYWYDKTPQERKEAGLEGRKEFMGEMGLNRGNMCDTLVEGIETTFKNWKPKKKFNVYKLR
jgi:glycosyltransferase involved in cell wall biosynthesis